MGRIVYVKVVNSLKPAHQYVNLDGERIGEIWREKIDIVDNTGHTAKKWRWFANRNQSIAHPEEANAFLCKPSYGSKDGAVDALGCV